MTVAKLAGALFVLLLPAALPAGAQQSLPAIAPPGPAAKRKASGYSRIRVDVPGCTSPEWLFQQEKATLHGSREGTVTRILL